ncbi:MAG: hypothetical protein M3Y42_14190 [Actinomycetota bacterium]|nr:hypothetical protein [Actinomycetota bacterium]
MSASDSVLVQGLTPTDLTPQQTRLVRQYALTDRGDHIEWTDGKQVKRWRLADQAGADPSLPILSTVSRLHSGSAVAPIGRLDTVRPIYCDPDGRFLGYASAPRLWIKQLSEQCYPPQAFHGLLARGVELVDERFATVEQVERAHPGMSSSQVVSFYRRHAFLVILAIFIVVIAVVELITFLG